MKTVLWVDDAEEERHIGRMLLSSIDGIVPEVAASSDEAKRILESKQIDAVITDILRRNSDRSISNDDGHAFFCDYIRPVFPAMPVIFHTKNLPSTFETDEHSQYLSKWEESAKKEIELETRLADVVKLYDAFADWGTWNVIEPRLVAVNSMILNELRHVDDIWSLTTDRFEQLVAELLAKVGFSVLWIPGGKDGGIDIVATSNDRDFLIDVKRYRGTVPVSVELVRSIYGVAEAVGREQSSRIVHGGIITSSRFTRDAQAFRKTLRRRPLLKDGQWLRTELKRYAPRLRKAD